MKRINFYSIKQVKEKGGLYDLPIKRITSPYDAYQAIDVILELHNESAERFGILTLNTKNEIAGIHILFMGSLNCSVVHPREVFQAALLNNAASIFAFHNHPSGDPSPSNEDREVTKRLRDCGQLMGIQLLDHIIVGDQRSYYSFKEKENIL